MSVRDKGTRGLLERCELWGNAEGGVSVKMKGDPTLARCIIRDHTAAGAAGVCVFKCAEGKAMVGADCVFANNRGGDVVRQKFAPPAPPEMAALIGKPQAPRPALHEHALTYAQDDAVDGRACDVCRAFLTKKSGAFQCAGCGFDVCASCFNK